MGKPLVPGSTVLDPRHWRRVDVRAAVCPGGGARVIATSSSDEKLARVSELGASDGINYIATPDWDGRCSG